MFLIKEFNDILRFFRRNPEGRNNNKGTFNKSNQGTSYNIQEMMPTIEHSGETNRDGPTPNQKRGHQIEVTISK